jgi:hypothetical protein
VQRVAFSKGNASERVEHARRVVEGVACPDETDLATLPADYPILYVITIPDAVNAATQHFSMLAW